MPTYDLKCGCCLRRYSRNVPIDERHNQRCSHCDQPLALQMSAPLFRFKGVPTKGGGPDKFTADMLGIPLKELPSGLRTK